MPLHPVIESALRASMVRLYRELGVTLARVYTPQGQGPHPVLIFFMAAAHTAEFGGDG